jgi:hypothetical protein
MSECLIRELNHNHSHILNRCGTRRFDVFAEINGPRPKTIHPHTGQVGYVLDDGTIDYDGPGQRIFFPQHFRIHDLHRSHPNATWILNWRDPQAWVESVMKWGDGLESQFLNEYYMQGGIPYIPTNLSDVRELLIRLYMEHMEMVREFVQQYPTHALVEVNITDANAGIVLANAFGLNITDTWRNVNQNRKSDIQWQATKISTTTFGDLVGGTQIVWWILGVVSSVGIFGWWCMNHRQQQREGQGMHSKHARKRRRI